MCQDWMQEYTGCHHVSRKLINCPTYYKQQSSFTGFFGRLFRGRSKNKKNCGRIIPHYADPKPFCPKCIIQNDQLRARYVGDGALRVYRPAIGDDFQDHSRRRRQADGEFAKRTARYSRRGSSNHNRTATNITPDGSVWIPDLYHHPHALAQGEVYYRAAGAAPPVDPRRSSRKARKAENKPQASERSWRKRYEHSHSVNAGSAPAFSDSQPLKRPTYHYQNRRIIAGHGSSVLPAPGPSLHPEPTRHDDYHWSQQRQRDPNFKIPTWHADAEPSEPPAMEHPPLRRKRGQVHKTSRPNPPPAPRIPPVPPPRYQVYLNALNFASENSASESERIAKLPRPLSRKKKRKKRNDFREDSRKLRRAIGFSATPESDDSFVCQHSKQLALHQGRQSFGRW
ncbi:hypothetical protein F4677DRAFT_212662 [Hypoxylon crocopeplum]|nr:hypothetical protein F4677DRAFT_212662 [Hypoxylon crocopeplum]